MKTTLVHLGVSTSNLKLTFTEVTLFTEGLCERRFEDIGTCKEGAQC